MASKSHRCQWRDIGDRLLGRGPLDRASRPVDQLAGYPRVQSPRPLIHQYPEKAFNVHFDKTYLIYT